MRIIEKNKINITNSQNLALLNKSETNLEDDSLVLFEETPHVKQKLNISGIKAKIIPPSSFSPDGKLQKYGNSTNAMELRNSWISKC